MLTARRDYYLSLTPAQAARVRRDCRTAIRLAFAGRHTQPRRAAIVVGCNIRTLREMREVRS